jgi:O-antigen ligase
MSIQQTQVIPVEALLETRPLLRGSLWLILLEVAFIIPLSLGYTLEVILALAALFILPAFFHSFTNGISLLPLFLYMPVTLSESMGIQLSEVGILLLFLLYVGTVLMDRRTEALEKPLLIPILVFIFASICSMVNARYLATSIKSIIRLIEAFIFVFYITANYVETKKDLVKILRMLVLAGVIASLHGFYQFRVGGEETMGIERRIFGFIGGGYGVFIGTSIVCAFSLLVYSSRWIWKTSAFFSLCILGVAMILHQTRAWMGGTSLALLFVLGTIRPLKRLLRSCALIVVAGVFVLVLLQTNLGGIASEDVTRVATQRSMQMGLSASQNTGKFMSGVMRLMLWVEGYQIFKENPMFGFGIGNLRFRNMLTGELGDPAVEGLGYVDNQHLNVLYETGIFGFAAWSLLLILLLMRSLELLRLTKESEIKPVSSAVIGSLILFVTGGMFWCFTVTHEMIVLFTLLMGLLFASLRVQKRQEAVEEHR